MYAEILQDLEMKGKISDIDLGAKEAWYHRICRSRYQHRAEREEIYITNKKVPHPFGINPEISIQKSFLIYVNLCVIMYLPSKGHICPLM